MAGMTATTIPRNGNARRLCLLDLMAPPERILAYPSIATCAKETFLSETTALIARTGISRAIGKSPLGSLLTSCIRDGFFEFRLSPTPDPQVDSGQDPVAFGKQG